MANEWIENQATKKVNEDVKRELTGNLTALKNSARIFIEGVRNAISEIAQIDTTIRTKQRYSISDIYNAMKKSTVLTQKVVTLQFQFEIAYNQFCGRTIDLIWRDEKTGDLYYANEMTALQIYQTGAKKEDGRASVKPEVANLMKFEDYIKTLTGFGRRIYQHQQKYKSLQTEVTTRWEWNNNPQNEKYYNQKEKGSKTYIYRGTFYWKDGENWDHSKKINKGHITETYVDLMMSSDNVFTQVPPGVSENSIKQYWIYMQNHNLNNLPGIVQGDVALSGQEILQFAVKEGQFNTAAVGPYLTTAFLVLNFPENLNIKEVLKKRKLGDLGKKISEKMDILSKKEADETLIKGLSLKSYLTK